jgi:4-hydroxy-tetrahydrodipicolinate synthase
MDASTLNGILPALVTPMTETGDVDLDAFTQHAAWTLDEGVHGLVPCGTTGESATLRADEQRAVIARAVEVAAGQVPVVAGAGGNDTRVVAELGAAAAAAGADALLVVSPPYNKPPVEGLVAHYRTVADAAGLPIVLYNVPGRTGQNLSPLQVLEVAERVPEVVGVKEAAGRMDQILDLLLHRDPDFAVLSGDDDLTLPVLAAGADGVISVAANQVPDQLAFLHDELRGGALEAARTRFLRLLPLLRANFVETNPIPVKTALELMGRGPAHFRLPLVPLRPEHRAVLEAALEAAGVGR